MPGKLILVVDDSHTIRLYVRKILEKVGYQVVIACDGEEAVERVIENRPDLMILDVNMPSLDGYGVCQRLTDIDQQYANLPIVFLTAVKSQALQLLGNEFGAYMQKPVERDALLAVVEKQFSQPCV